jgi:hypothetical protein
MVNRFLLIVVFVPLAVILIALAVANRGPAAFTMDPFNPGNPALTIETPLFILLFAALAVGMIVGSMATWIKQGRYRKAARQRGIEAQAARDAATARDARRAAAGQASLPSPRA